MKVTLKDGPLHGRTVEVRGEYLTVPILDPIVSHWVYTWPDWQGDFVFHDFTRTPRPGLGEYWGTKPGVAPSPTEGDMLAAIASIRESSAEKDAEVRRAFAARNTARNAPPGV